jgi:cell division protein FtsL
MSTNTIVNCKPENVVRQLPWRLDNKFAIRFLLILGTFSLVGWLYLTQASAVTATRYQIDELRLELEQLQNQNTALSLEIAQLENIARVESRARELGLGSTSNVRYLAVPNYPVPPQVMHAELNERNLPLVMVELSPVDQPSPMADWWEETLDGVTAWVVEE